MGIRVTVKADMRRVSAEKERKAKAAVLDAAFRIEGDAKRNVRVDTGRLRASITTRFRKGGLAASIGTNVKYAAAQEFGIPGTKYGYTPYLWPAYRANLQRFLSAMRRL